MITVPMQRQIPPYLEEPYVGKYLGIFQTQGTVEHNSHRVRGTVFVVDERTLVIRDFTFDGLAPCKSIAENA